MTQVMTPSDKPITKGQAGKFADVFTDALVKSGLPSGPVQQVLATQGATLAGQFVALVRATVERIANMLSRHVTVDLTCSPQEALDATGRTQYTDAAVVAAMPKGQAEEEVFFFKLSRYVSDDELEREYDARILKPASPYSLAKVNTDDPVFADEHPNATHWKGADGKWHFATFSRWHGGRDVHVYRGFDWYDLWWFAGVRNSS